MNTWKNPDKYIFVGFQFCESLNSQSCNVQICGRIVLIPDTPRGSGVQGLSEVKTNMAVLECK